MAQVSFSWKGIFCPTSSPLTVREYETALKAYAMDAADRKGAGLADLAVPQLDDDPKNLLILWAVSEVARARFDGTRGRFDERGRKVI